MAPFRVAARRTEAPSPCQRKGGGSLGNVTRVRDTLRDALGAPAVGVRVQVALVAGAAPALVPGEQGTIVQQAEVVTGSDGVWEMDLTPNSRIVPAGTHYLVTARTAGTGVVTLRIVVPEPLGGGALWVGQLLAEPVPARQPAVPVGYLTDTTGFITGNVHVGAVPPPNPRVGTLWVNTTETV